MRFCFVQDNDCHWFMIPIRYRFEFNKWVEAVENDLEYKTDFDYDHCMIEHPSEYYFENPRLLSE